MKTTCIILCLLLLGLSPGRAAEKPGARPAGTGAESTGQQQPPQPASSKQKPLAPGFSPSEKIGADTVIAFPVDI